MKTTTVEEIIEVPKIEVQATPAKSAIVVHRQEWMDHEAQLAVVRRDLAPGLDNNEFEVFKGICKATGLNPIMRQIYAIKRNDKNSPTGYKICYQTGIDGLRLVADRTGKYAGNDDPVFEYKPGKDIPYRATVTVYKIVAGVRCPFTASALMDEYWPAEGQDYFYKDMPHLMLGKCAEALGLRKAFPAETCGLYVQEELLRTDPVIDIKPETGPIQQPRRAPANQSNPQGAHNPPTNNAATKGADPAPAPPSSAAAKDKQDWSVKNENQKWKQGHIENVAIAKTGSKDGKPWTLYRIDANGHRYGTFSETVATNAAEAVQAARPVWYLVEKNGDNLNILEIRF